MKSCRRCQQDKPASDYYPRSRVCKACFCARERERYHANRERRSEKHREWYIANVEAQRKAGIERARLWAEANPDRARAKARRSMAKRRATKPLAVDAIRRRDYEKNKTKRLAAIKAWRKRNPDRVISQAIKSKIKRRSRMASARVEYVDRLKVFERDGWVCGICKRPVSRDDVSIDHIIPIARGGDHTYENCQTAHLACNISKGAKMQESAA